MSRRPASERKGTFRVQTWLTHAESARLGALALREHTTRAEIIRRAVRAWCDHAFLHPDERPLVPVARGGRHASAALPQELVERVELAARVQHLASAARGTRLAILRLLAYQGV